MDGWPQGAEKVYAKLDEHPRSRAELIVLSKIEDKDWNGIICFLVASGRAMRTGTKRGTGYKRASGVPSPPPTKEIPISYVQSSVAISYHDLLTEVLGDLDLDNTPQTTRTNVSIQYNTHKGTETFSVDVVSSSKVDLIGDNSDDDTDEVSRLVIKLQCLGAKHIIDNRGKGGCLWVVDEFGVSEIVQRVASECAVRFFYKQEGARSTGGRAAWWTKGT